MDSLFAILVTCLCMTHYNNGQNQYSSNIQSQSQKQTTYSSFNNRYPPRYNSLPSYEPKYGFPLSMNKNQDFGDTYVPISLTSRSAYAVSLPLIKISFNNGSVTLVTTNSGVGIYSYFYTEDTVATISGGPLKNRYDFAVMSFINDGIYTSEARAATLEDDRGYPVYFRIVFYNTQYANFSEALEYRDGLAIIEINVAVEGKQPNWEFKPFENIVSQCTAYNASVPHPASKALTWLLASINEHDLEYYAYPGAYVNYHGKQYISGVMIYPCFNTHPRISYDQFKTLTKVQDKFNQSEATALALRPVNHRPIVLANGISVKWY